MSGQIFFEGGELFVKPAALLMMAGAAVNGEYKTDPPGAHSARRLMDNLIAAAVRGGFRQEDILRTVMGRGSSHRAMQLCELAIEAAGLSESVRIIDDELKEN